MTAGYVYVIRSENDLYKIGWSADPASRCIGLQYFSPFILTVVGVVPGTRAHERELHRLLAPWRVAGEWFRYSRALQALLDGLRPYVAPPPEAPVERPPADHSELIALAEAKAAELGISAKELCRKATNNPRMLDRLKAGVHVQYITTARIRDYPKPHKRYVWRNPAYAESQP